MKLKYIATFSIIVFIIIGFGQTQKTLAKPEKPEKSAKSAKKKSYTEHDYLMGEPDKDVQFPQDAFEQAKVLKKEKKLDEAADLLLLNLDKARKAGRGTTKLGKYLLRLNNILFRQGKDKKAIKYGEIGLKLITKDYKNAEQLSGWMVNGQSHLAMSFERQGKLKNALKMYSESIESATQAPEGKVSKTWLKFLKTKKIEMKNKLEEQ